MTSWRLRIHRCSCYLSVLSRFSKDEFNIWESSNLNLSWLKLSLISHELCLRVWWVEEVTHCFNVQLEATNGNTCLHLSFFNLLLVQCLEDHSYRSWNKTHRFLTDTAFHCEGFSSASLSISEDAHFEAIQSASHYVSDFVEDINLRGLWWKYFVKFEFVSLNGWILHWSSLLS